MVNKKWIDVSKLIKFLLIWMSQNLAIPFWIVGHIHLSVNIYDDAYEILSSVGMNLIVVVGFILDYQKQNKDE
tara:strand:+ start:493 stop:711 length:219 start_codon:yes stop_codon:yes gene_type:complete